MAAPLLPSGVIDIWGGAAESIALKSDGTVWTWGWDDYGLLGNGHGVLMSDLSTAYDSWVPFEVLGPGGGGHLSNIKAIAGGERHNAALDGDGNIWTWGWNAFGQLGIGTVCTNLNSPDCMSTTPVKIPVFTNIKAISSRGYHTIALKKDGSVWAWGYNDGGRLGDGTSIDRTSPVPIGGLSGHVGVTAISGGGLIDMALMADQSLMGWGVNDSGAVGNHTVANQPTPIPVDQSTGITLVKAVATGRDHVGALAPDGMVWTWGANSFGQLGDGTRNNSSFPVKVSGLSHIISVSAGDGSTVALEDDGTVWAWGINDKGELGDGVRLVSCSYESLPQTVTAVCL